MFTKPPSYIITKENLKDAYEHISKKSFGIDDVDFEEFEIKFSQNINVLIKSVLDSSYSPEPLKKIEINKENSVKKRPIGISSIKDKLIQRVLYESMNPYFDKLFHKTLMHIDQINQH